jgi:hypothetical protein
MLVPQIFKLLRFALAFLLLKISRALVPNFKDLPALFTIASLNVVVGVRIRCGCSCSRSLGFIGGGAFAAAGSSMMVGSVIVRAPFGDARRRQGRMSSALGSSRDSAGAAPQVHIDGFDVVGNGAIRREGRARNSAGRRANKNRSARQVGEARGPDTSVNERAVVLVFVLGIKGSSGDGGALPRRAGSAYERLLVAGFASRGSCSVHLFSVVEIDEVGAAGFGRTGDAFCRSAQGHQTTKKWSVLDLLLLNRAQLGGMQQISAPDMFRELLLGGMGGCGWGLVVLAFWSSLVVRDLFWRESAQTRWVLGAQ